MSDQQTKHFILQVNLLAINFIDSIAIQHGNADSWIDPGETRANNNNYFLYNTEIGQKKSS